MKNIVSFETAKALKAAGFPQPLAETGQFWYNDYGALTLIGRRETAEDGGEDLFYCTAISTGRTAFFVPVLKDAVFAPTATDILQELPENYYLGKDENEFNIREFLWFGDSGYEFNIVSHSDNPAEAAAAAWLAIKKDLEV